MKCKTLKLALLAFALTSTQLLQAQSDTINVVTSAVPFLRISPDARAGAMGDLAMATSPDANSSFYNLAKTPFATSKSNLGVIYTPWLKDLGLTDVYLMALSGYHQLDDIQAVSGSVRYFSLGNIQFTDVSGTSYGEGRPREFGLDFGYSRKLSDRIGLGMALRYIYSNLAAGAPSSGNTYKAGNAVAGDLSFFYTGLDDNGAGWNFGAAMTNLGTKIGYTNDATQKDYIPANLSIGTTYTNAIDDENKITFGIDLHKLMVPTPPSFTGDTAIDNVSVKNYRSKNVVSSWFSSFGDAPGGMSEELKEFTVSLGAEYTYNNQFSLRAGYFFEDKNKGNRKYMTVGFGMKYNTMGINFSYLVPSGQGVNRNPLSNTLRFGLVFDLAPEE